MIAPYRSSGRIQVFYESKPVAVEMERDNVKAVTFVDRYGDRIIISAPYVLDATELGDLLPLGNIEHVIGAESQSETGELHALEGDAAPLDQQSITWCFAIDYVPNENNTISRPEDS
jgi:hypothetical protein